jgi:hypothetical protein
MDDHSCVRVIGVAADAEQAERLGGGHPIELQHVDTGWMREIPVFRHSTSSFATLHGGTKKAAPKGGRCGA